MAGKPSPRMIAAMLAVVDEDIPPHAAALRFKLSPSTVYVSSLYRAWKDAGYDPHARQAVKNDLLAWQHEAAQRKPRNKGRI